MSWLPEICVLQGAKITTHFRQIGNQWGVRAPTGRMGEAGANRPQSVIGTRRVETSLACSTLGSSEAMLTMVKSVKTLTKSVGVSLLNSCNLSHLGYLYPATTPVMIKLDYDRKCPWV